jgi:hypothetical protein
MLCRTASAPTFSSNYEKPRALEQEYTITTRTVINLIEVQTAISQSSVEPRPTRLLFRLAIAIITVVTVAAPFLHFVHIYKADDGATRCNSGCQHIPIILTDIRVIKKLLGAKLQGQAGSTSANWLRAMTVPGPGLVHDSLAKAEV